MKDGERYTRDKLKVYTQKYYKEITVKILTVFSKKFWTFQIIYFYNKNII